MKRWMARELTGGFLVLCAACGAPQAPSPPPPGIGTTTVAAICAEPARAAGQVVTIAGVFQGWQVAGCQFPAAASRTVTRSDWLIRTGADCLYVTGGRPAELDPTHGDVGRQMELRATVERSEEGKVYLRYLDGRALGD